MGLIKQYVNSTKTSGIQVTEPTPIDDRTYVQTEEALINIFTGTLTAEEQAFIAILYDGMVVQVKDNRREYVWTEAPYGLLATGYTYPDYANGIYGQDYGGKTYNLVVYDRVNKVDITYSNLSDPGLFIHKKYLPFHVISDMASAIVTLKSSSSGFKELEYPDTIEVSATGLTVILDPKPALSEVFKITVS